MPPAPTHTNLQRNTKNIAHFPNVINDVLNEGYNVHPVPLLNSPVTDKIIKAYDNSNIKIDILFTLGYITSGAPKNIGII